MTFRYDDDATAHKSLLSIQKPACLQLQHSRWASSACGAIWLVVKDNDKIVRLEPFTDAAVKTSKTHHLMVQTTHAIIMQSRFRSLPIVREEDFLGPALSHPRQQPLCQIQSRLMSILWVDDMAIPSCCICHAPHQPGLQLCTHPLRFSEHTRMPAAQTIFKVDEIKLVAVFRMAGAYDRHGRNALR